MDFFEAYITVALSVPIVLATLYSNAAFVTIGYLAVAILFAGIIVYAVLHDSIVFGSEFSVQRLCDF